MIFFSKPTFYCLYLTHKKCVSRRTFELLLNNDFSSFFLSIAKKLWVTIFQWSNLIPVVYLTWKWNVPRGIDYTSINLLSYKFAIVNSMTRSNPPVIYREKILRWQPTNCNIRDLEHGKSLTVNEKSGKILAEEPACPADNLIPWTRSVIFDCLDFANGTYLDWLNRACTHCQHVLHTMVRVYACRSA